MTILISMLVLNAGVVVDAHALHGIAQQIAKAKQADPAAFQQLAALRDGDDVPAALQKMGARALWPMVELLGFEAQSHEGVTLSMQVALIDAVGALRDARTVPLFEAILRSDGQPFAIYRAAAQALARQSDEAASTQLINLSQGSGTKQDAILSGMGASSRPAVAQALVQELDAHPDSRRAASVIHGLAEMGAASFAKDDDASVRDAAAKALVSAYVRYDGEVRKEASHALLAVDAPHTELLIENEKMNGVAVSELKQLEQQLPKK